ncbi:MAG: hypothetical protein ACK5N8_08185 [Alphaproteobacteria bacterium]
MNRKSFLTVLLSSLFMCSTNAHSVVDFENYTPTLDNEPDAEIESAYLLSYTKTTEATADFSTYEKDSKGEWQKVFYKYDVTYDVNQTSKPVEFAEEEDQDKVIAHYFEMVDSIDNANYGNTIINYAIIDKIQGSYIGNVVESVGQGAYGGVIYNTNTINEITGDFINNKALGNYNVTGGAIYNGDGYERLINKITGNFIGNTVESNVSYAMGGAIQNEGIIHEITGNFINNSAISYGYSARGGAIASPYVSI